MEDLVTWLYVIVKNAGVVSERLLMNFILLLHYMSRDMTKQTKWVCVQRRLRSAWASAQSDQSIRCPHEEAFFSYHSEDSDQTGRMPRLIWVFAGRILIVLVLSCRGSYYHYFRMVYSPPPESHYIYFLGSRKKPKLKKITREKQTKTCFHIQHGRNL